MVFEHTILNCQRVSGSESSQWSNPNHCDCHLKSSFFETIPPIGTLIYRTLLETSLSWASQNGYPKIPMVIKMVSPARPIQPKIQDLSHSSHVWHPNFPGETYPLVNVHVTMERSTMLLMDKSTINGHFQCRKLYHSRQFEGSIRVSHPNRTSPWKSSFRNPHPLDKKKAPRNEGDGNGSHHWSAKVPGGRTADPCKGAPETWFRSTLTRV